MFIDQKFTFELSAVYVRSTVVVHFICKWSGLWTPCDLLHELHLICMRYTFYLHHDHGHNLHSICITMMIMIYISITIQSTSWTLFDLHSLYNTINITIYNLSAFHLYAIYIISRNNLDNDRHAIYNMRSTCNVLEIYMWYIFYLYLDLNYYIQPMEILSTNDLDHDHHSIYIMNSIRSTFYLFFYGSRGRNHYYIEEGYKVDQAVFIFMSIWDVTLGAALSFGLFHLTPSTLLLSL